jgi:hypothetical protein
MFPGAQMQIIIPEKIPDGAKPPAPIGSSAGRSSARERA